MASPADKNGTEGDKSSSDQIEVAITNEEKPKQTYAKDHKFTEEERMAPGIATGKYEVMVKEKKGFFGSAIPTKLPVGMAILLCFLNCVFPGLGTFFSAPFSLCEKNKPYKRRVRNFFVNILAAFLQLITTPLVFIGWLWSILWAIEYLKPLKGDNDGFEQP